MSPPRRPILVSVGFSLFEVLVVLAIVGLVSALTMTMVSQIHRNLDRFFPAAERYTRLEVRTNMLAATISSLVPSRNTDEAFKGEPRSMSGMATSVPAAPWSVNQPIRLDLIDHAEEASSVVQLSHRTARGPDIARLNVIQLPCTDARFYYLDHGLRWTDRWEQRQKYPYMPLAVRLSCPEAATQFHLISAIDREGASAMSDVNMLQLKR